MKTTAHCDEDITEGKMRALNRHMSHFDTTSSKFYQLPAAKTAVSVYNTIKQLSKKRFFTSERMTYREGRYAILRTLPKN